MSSQQYNLGVPTRFPEGVSTRLRDHPLGSFRDHDPSKLITVFDHFTDPSGGYATTGSAKWILTQTGTPTVGLADGVGGILSMVTSAGGTDKVNLQTQKKCFHPDESTSLWLYGRFNLADVTNPAFEFGFEGTTYLLKLFKATGSNQLYLRAKTPSLLTATNFTLTTRAKPTAATYFTLGLHFNFVTGAVTVYYNDVVDTIFNLKTTLGGNMTDEDEVALVSVQNAGVAQVNTLLVDFVVFSQERPSGQTYG